jgi:hypothetical protein
VPNHVLAGNNFRYFNFAKLGVLVAVRKLITEFFGSAFDIF